VPSTGPTASSFVTAEYNHGYPAALKNAMDHLFPEFNRKPVAFVGYGNVGGARAIEQLRQVVVELEMAPVAPRRSHPAGPHDRGSERRAVLARSLCLTLDQRLGTMVSDLLWWTAALGAARASAG
jgi:NAD(P)H-dependent FMN reductase